MTAVLLAFPGQGTVEEITHRTRARNHAIRRLWQRFGIALATPELVDLERRIWAGRAKWQKACRGMRQAYRLVLRGRQLVAVFDIHLDCIVTIMPVGWKVYG